MLSNCRAFCSDDSFLNTIYATLNPFKIRTLDGYWSKTNYVNECLIWGRCTRWAQQKRSTKITSLGQNFCDLARPSLVWVVQSKIHENILCSFTTWNDKTQFDISSEGPLSTLTSQQVISTSCLLPLKPSVVWYLTWESSHGWSLLCFEGFTPGSPVFLSFQNQHIAGN